MINALPLPALIMLGAILALIVGACYLGLWKGQNAAPSASNGAAQVAAVIVDPTALNAAAAEVAGLTIAIHSLVPTMKDAAANSVRIADEIDAIREELRIHRELSRR